MERLGTVNSICPGVLLQRRISTPTSTRVIADTSSFSHCVKTTRAVNRTAQPATCQSFKLNYRKHVMYIYCCMVIHSTFYICLQGGCYTVCAQNMAQTISLMKKTRAEENEMMNISLIIDLKHTCVSATCLHLAETSPGHGGLGMHVRKENANQRFWIRDGAAPARGCRLHHCSS